jgi:ribonuclease HII
LVAAISAASILAKTERDRIMEEYHEIHPQYNWKTNMGYPTIEHRKAIQQYGPTEIHRKSFRLLPENQQKLF